MGKVYGIDLGTTYSVIATVDERTGLPRVIDNDVDNTPTLPSAVYFPENESDGFVVGNDAKLQAEIEPDRVVQFVKREIGKQDGKVYEFYGKKFDPIMISSIILKRIKEYADAQGEDVHDVIITCPANFGISEKTATRQAGEIAGFNVLNIIHEPTAAALYYMAKEFPEDRTILVYDLGGGTFDVSLAKVTSQGSGDDAVMSVDIIDSRGDDHLGGADWDQRLFDIVWSKFLDEIGEDEDDIEQLDVVKAGVYGQIEDAKKRLTNFPNRNVSIAYSGGNIPITITRDEFVEVTKDLVQRTLDFTDELLKEKGKTPDDIDDVLLVGGSTMMPMIFDAVTGMFPKEHQVHREAPHLAVAEGAAIAASLKLNEINENDEEKHGGGHGNGGGCDDHSNGDTDTNDDNNVTTIGRIGGETGPVFEIKDRLTRSFGPAVYITEVGDLRIDNIMFYGDPSPATVSQTYATVVDNQTAIEVGIYENMSTDRQNTFIVPTYNLKGEEQATDPLLKVKQIGTVSGQLPAGLPAGTQLRVEFKYGSNGLIVNVYDMGGTEIAHADIISEGLKSASEIQADAKFVQQIPTFGQL